MSNSLAEVHPQLVSEWSEKNLTLTPDDITFGSNKKVWWRGACGHEWQASVKARSNGEKCPICSGARVIAGINDLATLEPLLAKQWSKKNKIKPTEVSIGSHKKVIWRCEKGHEWEAAKLTGRRTGVVAMRKKAAIDFRLTSGPAFFFFFSYRSTFTRIWSPAIILSYHLSCHRRTCRD